MILYFSFCESENSCVDIFDSDGEEVFGGTVRSSSKGVKLLDLQMLRNEEAMTYCT